LLSPAPDQKPPWIHAAYWPTWGVKAGDEVTFKVRSFNVAPDEGQEEWDFGDGTPKVCVQSDGYAVTQHAYRAAGQYLL
jgi:hypothetical protein